MCGLCGVLGAEEHWTDSAADGGSETRTRRRERLGRVALANRVLAHYGLKLADFQGRAYVLRNATGRQQMVDHLGALWPVAEKLAGRPCDPLDDALLRALARA